MNSCDTLISVWFINLGVSWYKKHSFVLVYLSLERYWQEVNRTYLVRRFIRSFLERQKQSESEMKGLILMKLILMLILFLLYFRSKTDGSRITYLVVFTTTGFTTLIIVTCFVWIQHWKRMKSISSHLHINAYEILHSIHLFMKL